METETMALEQEAPVYTLPREIKSRLVHDLAGHLPKMALIFRRDDIFNQFSIIYKHASEDYKLALDAMRFQIGTEISATVGEYVTAIRNQDSSQVRSGIQALLTNSVSEDHNIINAMYGVPEAVNSVSARVEKAGYGYALDPFLSFHGEYMASLQESYAPAPQTLGIPTVIKELSLAELEELWRKLQAILQQMKQLTSQRLTDSPIYEHLLRTVQDIQNALKGSQTTPLQQLILERINATTNAA